MRTQVTLAGNLGRDPELRFTPSGMAVCTFTVAVGSRVKNAAGEYEDGPTSWYECIAFKTLAEACADKLSKGSKVVLTGTLTVEDWQTKEGESRRSVKVAVDEVGVSVRASGAQREQPKQADVWGNDSAPF